MKQLDITAEALDRLSSGFTEEYPPYLLTPELNNAVKLALALGQPLLVTGEPGTGKTTLAQKIALDLHGISKGAYHDKVYFFPTKSTTVYNDLFYTYDALTHFYDANIKKEKEKPVLKNYISLNAMGLAIAASMDPEEKEKIPARNVPGNEVPRNSVVLIDEIDKAPKDFPNDLLFELDKYRFLIKEAEMKQFAKPERTNILVIITSNGENKLPEAFLRRCIFFHIKFPSPEMLKDILKEHGLYDKLQGSYTAAMDTFLEIRKSCTYKKPSTAELVSWFKILSEENIDISKSSGLLSTLPLLVKDESDLLAVKTKFRL